MEWKDEKIIGDRESDLPIRTCSGHRSFYCAKGGVYTHYNRSIMVIANVYTQRERQRHRMCGVWSPLISDRLQATYLSFFFYEAHMSTVRRFPIAHLSVRNLPLRCDLMATVKTRQHVFQQMANASRSQILKFQTSTRGKKWHFHRAKSWEHISCSLFLHSWILLAL